MRRRQRAHYGAGLVLAGLGRVMNAVSEPCWMVYASFAISVLTLAVLIWYAWLTRGIEKAANEQSEGLAKPVIVVESSPDIPDSNVDRAILGGGLFSEIVNGVRLLNIGTGPALWVEWSTKGQHNTGEGPESGSAGFVPYLRPNETVDTECSRAYVSGLNYLTVECRYQSLSRTRYTSRTTIGDRDSANHADRFKITSFEIR